MLGIYYSPITDLKVASNRSTVQTLALLFPSDVKEFGLSKCLETSIKELRLLVENGCFDEKSQHTLQVRLIASLGDNLEQNEVCGIVQNFATTQHSCRKCLCSRDDLKNCTEYSDIHSRNHEPRTNQMLSDNYEESLELEVTHVNGVTSRSLYHEFPFFNIPKQLPQCARLNDILTKYYTIF